MGKNEADRPAHETNGEEIEITPAMVRAGEEAILELVGGADLGGLFSAADLAARVYRAMASAEQATPLSPPR